MPRCVYALFLLHQTTRQRRKGDSCHDHPPRDLHRLGTRLLGALPPAAPRTPQSHQRPPTVPQWALWSQPVSVPNVWRAPPRAPCLWQPPLSPVPAAYNPPGLQHHLDTQLPGPHCLLTCTVPESLRPCIRSHQRPASQAMFHASALVRGRGEYDAPLLSPPLPTRPRPCCTPPARTARLPPWPPHCPAAGLLR